MKTSAALTLLASAALASAQATVYLIRHGEKPSSGSGLSSQGEERAQCLRNVFGESSDYDIGYIMAEQPQSDGSMQRPYDTVEPLAQDLGITVDTSCYQTDMDCITDVIDNYDGPGNILVCWEHKHLNNIVEALGAKSQSQYPDVYNLIWYDPYPYSGVTDTVNEDCPGLDN